MTGADGHPLDLEVEVELDRPRALTMGPGDVLAYKRLTREHRFGPAIEDDLGRRQYLGVDLALGEGEDWLDREGVALLLWMLARKEEPTLTLAEVETALGPVQWVRALPKVVELIQGALNIGPGKGDQEAHGDPT